MEKYQTTENHCFEVESAEDSVFYYSLKKCTRVCTGILLVPVSMSQPYSQNLKTKTKDIIKLRVSTQSSISLTKSV